MDSLYLFWLIVIGGVVTYLTRVMPFWFFKNPTLSPRLLYIQKYMPLAIMVILVFYSLKDVEFNLYPYGLVQIGTIALTIALHVRYKNVLLSVFVATFVYMCATQYLL